MFGDTFYPVHFYGVGYDSIPMKNTCVALEMLDG
jgi:hypothetical protein